MGDRSFEFSFDEDRFSVLNAGAGERVAAE